mmetsp:Transcript_8910/g.21630  ORF Transcript_8910/g.21630 Transcript_8910/m.21630 type:complete len:86 (-) Transcript_8910:99-356(-)
MPNRKQNLMLQLYGRLLTPWMKLSRQAGSLGKASALLQRIAKARRLNLFKLRDLLLFKQLLATCAEASQINFEASFMGINNMRRS